MNFFQESGEVRTIERAFLQKMDGDCGTAAAQRQKIVAIQSLLSIMRIIIIPFGNNIFRHSAVMHE
ncbi:hypothetical protein [Nitrosovibrio sp. Nv6]|uniref:hypothetical protein n=1 Tax=Nitrosovibrio sp. Nv6 TaxID=1855340 RepID=UPI00115FEEE1|nr:hypothetical protein [Nitrosovibrio sp. Nv6]